MSRTRADNLKSVGMLRIQKLQGVSKRCSECVSGPDMRKGADSVRGSFDGLRSGMTLLIFNLSAAEVEIIMESLCF